MALFIRQDENRSDLQKRLETDLQEKAKQQPSNPELPDGVNDTRYVEGTKKTTSLAWLWLLVVVIFVGVLIWMIASGK